MCVCICVSVKKAQSRGIFDSVPDRWIFMMWKLGRWQRGREKKKNRRGWREFTKKRSQKLIWKWKASLVRFFFSFPPHIHFNMIVICVVELQTILLYINILIQNGRVEL